MVFNLQKGGESTKDEYNDFFSFPKKVHNELSFSSFDFFKILLKITNQKTQLISFVGCH